MKVRVLATLLWFVAGWSGTGFVVAVAGWSPAVAVIGGLATAMFVWFDPSGRLWAQSKSARRIRSADEVAAELDSRAAMRTHEAVEPHLR